MALTEKQKDDLLARIRGLESAMADIHGTIRTCQHALDMDGEGFDVATMVTGAEARLVVAQDTTARAVEIGERIVADQKAELVATQAEIGN